MNQFLRQALSILIISISSCLYGSFTDPRSPEEKLYCRIICKDAPEALELINAIDVKKLNDYRAGDNLTLVETASFSGSLDIVRGFINKEGIDLNSQCNPLIYNLLEEPNKDIVQALCTAEPKLISQLWSFSWSIKRISPVNFMDQKYREDQSTANKAFLECLTVLHSYIGDKDFYPQMSKNLQNIYKEFIKNKSSDEKDKDDQKIS